MQIIILIINAKWKPFPSTAKAITINIFICESTFVTSDTRKDFTKGSVFTVAFVKRNYLDSLIDNGYLDMLFYFVLRKSDLKILQQPY